MSAWTVLCILYAHVHVWAMRVHFQTHVMMDDTINVCTCCKYNLKRIQSYVNVDNRSTFYHFAFAFPV